MSSTEKYIDLLKLQATTSSDPAAAKDAINTLEHYGYKAVPALKDVLETCTDVELKELATDVLRRLGWGAYPSSSDSEEEEADATT